MEIFILISVVILLFLGVLGSILPILPGPILSYIALLLYHFFIASLSINSIIWISIGVFFVSVLDYFLQIYGVKKAGGGKYAIRGSMIGMLLGFFLFPPFGILIGAFIGAYIGAKIEIDQNAMKIAFGALWGFVLGAMIKLSISVYIIYFLFFL